MRSALVIALLCATATVRSAAPVRFYDDDPLGREPETQDAAGAVPRDLSLAWDTLYNLFARRPDGVLRFSNIAVEADVARRPAAYETAWYAYDNASNASRALGRVRSAEPAVAAPAALPHGPGAFIRVDVFVTGGAPDTPTGLVRWFFRGGWDRWTVVGVDRGILGPAVN